MYVISCAFRQRVAIVEEFLYWTLLTPLWDPLSDTGIGRSDEAVIMKNDDMWP